MPNLIDQYIRIPRYLSVSEELRTQILAGLYKPGDRLPSYNEMKQQFEADQRTVEKTYALLEEEGLIRRIPGRGAFVCEPEQRSATGFIGFLDDNSGRNVPFFMEILRGARECCAESGKSLAMIDNPMDFSLWDSMDGLLICDMGLFPQEDVAEVVRPGMPQVKLFYDDPLASLVGVDDRSGIQQSLEHLFELGHRNIGYFGSIIGNAHPYLVDRHNAYRETLLQNGIQPLAQWTYIQGKPDMYDYREHGYRLMQSWLESGWRDLNMTAILAQNDHMARGMIHALAENGYSVPGDVSVIGFDGTDISQFSALSLTTVVLPLRPMGNTAMKLLLQLIENPTSERQVVRMPVQLHIGQSTARVKEA